MSHVHLKYPNLSIFFGILFLTFILVRSGALLEWVSYIGGFGYLGVFLAGILFVSTFTVVPATAALIVFSGQFNIFLVSFIAGFGALIGDYTIFRFVKDGLVGELRSIFHKVGGYNILKGHHIVHTKYFGWLGPVLGAFIIASPLPDELGIGILGIYRLGHKKFAALSFVLNTVGIFLLLAAARSLT